MELLEKNIDVREFLKLAGPFLVSKRNYPISGNFKIGIQNSATKHLGLRDLFQLRDRFEGQAYLDNLLLRASAISIIEQHFELSLIDWNKLGDNRKTNLNSVSIQNKRYQVVSFLYGSMPMLSMEFDSPLIFCAIRPDLKSGIICGVLEEFSLENPSLFDTKIHFSLKKAKKFIGFKFLKELPSLKIL